MKPRRSQNRRALLERRAEVLVEAYVSRDDAKTATRYGLTDRTLRNWRAALDTDAEFSEIFLAKKAAATEGWADQVPGALRESIAFLRRAAESGDHKDPNMVHSVAGAMKLLSEVSATWKLLDVRLSRSAGPAGPSAQPTAADGGARQPAN